MTAQFFLQPYLAGFNNFHDVFNLKHPTEMGRQKGLTVSGEVVDGIFILRQWDPLKKSEFELADTISFGPPYRLILCLRKQEEDSFRLYFSTSPGRDYYFSYCDRYLDQNGIFVESGNESTKIMDTSGLVVQVKNDSDLEIEIVHDGRFLNTTVNEAALERIPFESLEKGYLKVVTGRIRYTLVDRVEIQRIMPDGAARILVEADFLRNPVFIDLPKKFGQESNSRASRLLAFTLFVLIAFLIDRFLLSAIPHRARFSLVLFGFLFIGIPLQVTISFIVRACLALPCISLFLFIAMLLVLKLLFLFYCGIVLGRPERREAYPYLWTVGIILVIVSGSELAMRGNPWLNRHLDYKKRVMHLNWNLEEHTNLLKNKEGKEILEVAGSRYTIEKRPGVYRIVCLGSSSTQGYFEHNYPFFLEGILQERTSVDVEVINGGIGGAPFYMLKVYLEEVLLLMDPDLVIIYFGNNKDFKVARLYYARLKEEMAEAPLIRSNEEMWAAMRLRWSSPWMIKGLLALAELRSFSGCMLMMENLRNCIWPEQGFRIDDKSITGDLNRTPAEIVQLCVGRGKKVVLIPEVTVKDIKKGRGTEHDYYEIFQELAERWAGRGVYFKTVLDAFIPEIAFSYIIDEMHMNDQGYTFLADQIADFLDEKEVIPRDLSDRGTGR